MEGILPCRTRDPVNGEFGVTYPPGRTLAPDTRHDGGVSRRLSDTEQLLWSLEQNPNLGSTMGAVVMLDGNPDPDRLRTTVARAVANVDALSERVQESSLPLDPPAWVPDVHFDLDHHLRFIRLGSKPSPDDLMRLVTQIVNDPFDRTRPLWQMTLIGGLRNRKSVLVSKLHHSIADGAGALKLAEHLLEFVPDAPAPEPFDLDAVVRSWDAPPEEPKSRSMADTIRLGAERVIGMLNDAAGTLNEPARVAAAGTDVVKAARAFVEHIPGTDHEASPLLANRSRNRRLIAMTAPMEPLKAAARAMELSLNDLFVGAAGQAVTRYHRAVGEEPESFTATAIVSTRTADSGERDNAFVPVTLTVPGGDATFEEQALAIGHQVRAKREQLSDQPDLLKAIGSMSGLIPSAVMTNVAIEQASRIDFATSNLPGPPIPMWLAGTKIREIVPIGPVAGTAFNLTLLSYDGTAGIGLHLDPSAVADPERLVDAIVSTLSDLGVSVRVA